MSAFFSNYLEDRTISSSSELSHSESEARNETLASLSIEDRNETLASLSIEDRNEALASLSIKAGDDV